MLSPVISSISGADQTSEKMGVKLAGALISGKKRILQAFEAEDHILFLDSAALSLQNSVCADNCQIRTGY